METGKTAKYFKYAISEIILVVIGILIALQINNWNEQRKNDNEVASLSKSMISDLQSDIKHFERNLIRNDSVFNDHTTINAIVLNSDTTKDLRTTTINLLRYYTFRPNNATYKSVVSNNFLGKFDNATEKEIIDYYEYSYHRLKDFVADQKTSNVRIADVLINEFPSVYSADKVYSTKALELLKTDRMVNMVYADFFVRQRLQNVIKKTKEEAQELIRVLRTNEK